MGGKKLEEASHLGNKGLEMDCKKQYCKGKNQRLPNEKPRTERAMIS